MAPPKKKVDVELLKKLASIHCTNEEMASMLGVSADTLERRYAGVIKEAKDQGKTSLRRYMWLKAQEGNTTMMIWLSKNLLGYTDKNEIQQTTTEEQKLVIEYSGAVNGDETSG